MWYHRNFKAKKKNFYNHFKKNMSTTPLQQRFDSLLTDSLQSDLSSLAWLSDSTSSIDSNGSSVASEDTITIDQELARRKQKLVLPQTKINYLKSPFVNSIPHSDRSTQEEDWF